MHAAAEPGGMRRALALLLVPALLLPGCAEDVGWAPGARGASIVAYADLQAEDGPNRTILVLRGAGVAERLTYLGDGSWLPRLAPGLDYPREELDLLFEAPSAGRERGGLVVRIERGSVGERERDALRPFLEGEWPAPFVPPGAEEPHPWYRPLVMARAQPFAATEAPPDGNEHLGRGQQRVGELADAFRAAARSFQAASVEEAEGFGRAFGGCMRSSTSVSPEAARVGEVFEVRASVTNCGSAPVTLDFARCAQGPSATVQVGGMVSPFAAALPASEEPSAAYAMDAVCRGDAAPLTLAPGATETLVRRWNGTYAACRTAHECEFRPATPGEYGLVTWATGQDEAAFTGVTLLAAQPETTRFLLVRESDWLNSTSSESIPADFGPHCAPVGYRTRPPAVTLWYYEEKPPIPSAVVVRDWRDGHRPDNVMTFSADRLAVALLHEGNATLASPFSASLPLAEVALDGEDFLVNGTRLAPGERFELRVAHTLHENGGTYDAVSILAFENVGLADVLFARAGLCA